jgi:uncharacterized repeat protein (TIGR03803 family)
MKKSKLYPLAIAFATLNLVFSNCNAQFTTLLNFDQSLGAQGNYPLGSLISDGTFLYGTTPAGGTSTACTGGCGTIFKIKPDGTGDTVLLNFNRTNGADPVGSLFYDGTFLYGMTAGGGTNDDGTIFRIMPNGTRDTVLLNFNGINGNGPFSSLISDGTFFYGTTYNGGTSTACPGGCGTIFKIKPNGTGDTVLLNFNRTNGANPTGSLIYDGTFLYGTTESGGINDDGTIFKIKPNGMGDTVLLNFNGTNGAGPEGSLFYDGTFLYGMTNGGGICPTCVNPGYNGTIFKIKPNGTGDTVLLNFNGANGQQPRGSGSLISDGTFLYGMTLNGGTTGYGTIFKIKPDGTGDTVLFNFNRTNGGNPLGSLYSDGTFLYGMTEIGGTHDDGTVFKYQYCFSNCSSVTGITEYSLERGINVYPSPTSGIINVNLGQIENAQANIYNLLGESVCQHIITSSIYQIDLSAQPNGVYFIKLITEQGIVNKKVVISH